MPYFSFSSIRSKAIMLCVFLPACVGTSPEKISTTAVQAVKTELPSLQASQIQWHASHYLATDASPWWQEFDDEVLHNLVAVTLKNANSVSLAVARLEESIANARASRSDLFPTLNLDGRAGVSSSDLENGGLQSNPARTNTASIDFDLAWQSDLFGRLRNASSASDASLQAASSRVRDAQRLVVARVVQSYYQLVSIRERIKLTAISVQRRDENVERIDQLLIQGYATALDKTRADSQLYEARASLAQLELSEITLLNQLSTITGIDIISIRKLLVATGELIMPPTSAPLPSIPLLIQHRPDLRAVERDLVAAAYNVNSSLAALYPTLGFSLSVGKGPDGGTLGAFPALDVITGSILSNLAMPILGRGRLLAAIDVNSARLKQAHSTFESTALQVISELDTAIASIDKNRVIFEQRALASGAAREAAELSKELFKAGELDYTSVILAEQTRVSAENNGITSQEALINAYVTYMAAVAPAW